MPLAKVFVDAAKLYMGVTQEFPKNLAGRAMRANEIKLNALIGVVR